MKRFFMILLVGCAAVSNGPGSRRAWAGFDVSADSSAYALSTDLTLTLLPVVNVTGQVGPVASVAGAAPPAYDSTMHLASFSATAGAYALPLLPPGSVVDASTGIIDTEAFSSVDGTPGSKTTFGMVTINNLDQNTVTTISTLLHNLLGITADTIVSSSTVTGTYGSLTPVGSMVVTNLNFSTLGAVQATFNGSVAANTSVDLSSTLANVSVILNEQTVGGDGITLSSIETNAIHVRFDGTVIAGVGSLSGDIIVGHSFAEIRAVPEPTSLTLLGAGAMIGLVRCCRRRGETAAAA